LIEDVWREVDAIAEEARDRMKTKKTLKIGIAPGQAIARHTRNGVTGRRRRSAENPDVWFTSVESFAKVMSDRNRGLLALIAERRPESIDALAAASGRAKSNLSRTLATMARYGLVRLENDEGRRLKPVVMFERVELKLSLAA
jgi:predicted transcriptional regulator